MYGILNSTYLPGEPREKGTGMKDMQYTSSFIGIGLVINSIIKAVASGIKTRLNFTSTPPMAVADTTSCPTDSQHYFGERTPAPAPLEPIYAEDMSFGPEYDSDEPVPKRNWFG